MNSSTTLNSTPKGMRLHIGIFGRRNAGKSSLLNAFTRQIVSIVSDIAGTTTDPVEKPMELLPFGPVLFIDTAGIDDSGTVGALRTARTVKVFDRTDLAILVVDGDWTDSDDALYATMQERRIPVVVVRNKSDLTAPDSARLNQFLAAHPDVVPVRFSAYTGQGIAELREAILASAPPDLLQSTGIIHDLIAPGALILLVVPIDKEAPKGRLILPQVQVIRDVLDSHAMCLVVQDQDIAQALTHLQTEPAMVVTDSQAFASVVAQIPAHIPMTGFSILFARFKGDLATLVDGALAIDRLRPGDRVLIAEACSHHPIQDDIGRVKIPDWVRSYCGFDVTFDVVAGKDLPDDLARYRLVIHCGGCTFNRQLMLRRMLACVDAGVPITNYGLVIAYSLGLFERALQPFPECLALYQQHRQRSNDSSGH